MATYAELKAQAEELMRQAEELRKDERNGVIAELKAKIFAYGITVRDLGLATATKSSKGAAQSSGVVPKYRGPAGELWSGRGRQPVWMSSAIGAGKKKEDFLI